MTHYMTHAGDMEHTGFPDASFDVVSVQFVTHECPAHIIDSLVGVGSHNE